VENNGNWKSLSQERRKSESAEAQLREMKGKGDEDIQAVRAVAENLQGQVNEAQNAARQAQMSLGALQEATTFKEEALLAQLEQHRSLLRKVAQEYSRLAFIPVATSFIDSRKPRDRISGTETENRRL
jgi:chromosome segregation ATPase